MSDIFICYKDSRRREVRQLASALAARGWTIWWDWNIPTRADWQAELDAQLDAAGCVVVLWSAESVRSEWVLYEARHAKRAGKLIQVLLEPLQPPFEFASLQAVLLADWEFGARFHAGYQRLLITIREMLDAKVRTARRLCVFMCHSSADKSSIRSLCTRLKEVGIDPWLDEERLLPGQKWQEEIPAAVKNCDAVLVCLSKGSVNKAGYVQKEIRYALDVAQEQPEGVIFLIPARLEDCTVPNSLQVYQWVNLYEESGYERLLMALAARAVHLGIRRAADELRPESQVLRP